LNGKELILDLSTVDLTQQFADIAEIRRWNSQRYEMEQLTAIVLVDNENHICLGYKDIAETDFWVRGHMPGRPLMPGVIMCEAAAQLSSYYATRFDLLGADTVGFGGLEEVRFRDTVVPGDRLYLVCQMTRLRRGRMIVCRFQGLVNHRVVVEGVIKGIPLWNNGGPEDAAAVSGHGEAREPSGRGKQTGPVG
jgi:3-hydroxyacyl-[acyl-carrier-protein] dehydratase